MTEKTAQSFETLPVSQPAEDSRVLPLAVAGLVCFVIAVILGAGSWFFFGSHARKKVNQESVAEIQPIVSTNANVQNTAVNNETANANSANENTAPPVIEGIVKIEGGEVVLGGSDTKLPPERAVVGDFSIAETEVTNAQYAEFIRETKYPAPLNWKNGETPAGRENFPVVNVSWNDAAEFCKWLEKKINLPVRLPTEAEWEFAARGREGNKYPWGNNWNAEAAASLEKGGKISAVRSFSLNRSPFGVYDMVGNVWEWTQNKVEKTDIVTDETVKEALEKGEVLRVVKGGSAREKAAQISAQTRYEIPETTRNEAVGFRYVIIQKK